MPSPVEAVTSAGSSIGGYFNLVSIVPSGVFVVGAAVLAVSGAPGAEPEPARVLAVLSGNGLGFLGLVASLTLLLGLVLHPLQFSLVQLYEGYWGLSRPAVAVRARWTEGHRLRAHVLGDLVAADPVPGEDALHRRMREVLADEAGRLDQSYPPDTRALMPTRLGNVLRSYEGTIGTPYGLDAARVLAHVALVADRSHVDYLNDQRSSLDLAVRMSFLMYLLSGCYFVALWPYGAWILLAAVPASLGILSYRGSVVVAHHYGQAMGALVDLNRFALYERLRISLPADTLAERTANTSLMKVLGRDPRENLRLRPVDPRRED